MRWFDLPIGKTTISRQVMLHADLDGRFDVRHEHALLGPINLSS